MAEATLECEDCGAVNPAHAQVCNLCGASLEDERAAAERGSVVVLAAVTLVVTAVMVGLPAAVLYWVMLLEVATVDRTTFVLGYALVWALLTAICQYYEPKEHYDLGLPSRVGLVGRPLSLRDDIDRAHYGLGMALFPVNIVRELWIALYRRIKEG